MYFDGADDSISVSNTIANVQSVSFWEYSNSNSGNYLRLTSSVSVSAASGTVSGNNFSSPTVYVNGVANGKVKAFQWNHIIITTDTGISSNGIKFGVLGAITYFAGFLDDIRLYNYALSPCRHIPFR